VKARKAYQRPGKTEAKVADEEGNGTTCAGETEIAKSRAGFAQEVTFLAAIEKRWYLIEFLATLC